MKKPDEDSWKFTAAFRLGMNWQEAGDYVRAEAAYLEALALQPKHLPTLYNLAVTQIRLGAAASATHGRGTYVAASRTLAHLCELVELEDPTADQTWRLDAYPVAYNRALVFDYAKEVVSADVWSSALSTRTLAAEGESATARAIGGLERPALMLRAGILVSKRAEEGGDLSELAAAALEEPDRPSREKLKGHLDDPMQIEWYVRGDEAADTRTRYNLACYAARLAELVPRRREALVARVLEQAELALQDTRLVPWASRDPSLAVLRARSDWRELLDSFTPPKAEPRRDVPEQPAAQREEPIDGAAPAAPERSAEQTTARQRVVDQAVLLLGELHPGLPQPRNPLDRLRALREAEQPLTDAEFHARVAALVAGLHDPATQYLLPGGSRDVIAVLPFRLRECLDDAGNRWQIVATDVDPRTRDPGFVDGTEITHWNDEPIGDVIERRAVGIPGRTAEERRARALITMTHRPEALVAPPEEDYVIVGCGSDPVSKLRAAWDHEILDPRRSTGSSPFHSSDPLVEAIQRARLGASFPAVKLHPLPDKSQQILRLPTFDVGYGFVDDVAAALKGAPAGGLLVDVRGNPGGSVAAAERVLQLFAKGRVRPQPIQLVATDLARSLCQADGDLRQWSKSIDGSLASGQPFSAARPLRPNHEEACNSHGRAYQGPVVLVVDALCAGATDVFIAGWVDHEIGPVLSSEHRRGGLGGFTRTNVELLRRLPDAKLEPLEGHAGLQLSIARGIRVGKQEDEPPTDRPDDEPPADRPHDVLPADKRKDEPLADKADDEPPADKPDDEPPPDRPDDEPPVHRADHEPSADKPVDEPSDDKPEDEPPADKPKDEPPADKPGGEPPADKPQNVPAADKREDEPLGRRGVVPDVLHATTRRDVLKGEPDLLRHAVALLSQQGESREDS